MKITTTNGKQFEVIRIDSLVRSGYWAGPTEVVFHDGNVKTMFYESEGWFLADAPGRDNLSEAQDYISELAAEYRASL